jgi:hypothetical protein
MGVVGLNTDTRYYSPKYLSIKNNLPFWCEPMKASRDPVDKLCPIRKDYFQVPMEWLMDPRKQDELRKLSKAFADAGGRIARGKGAFRLTHTDPDYLKKFRKQLLKTIGLVQVQLGLDEKILTSFVNTALKNEMFALQDLYGLYEKHTGKEPDIDTRSQLISYMVTKTNYQALGRNKGAKRIYVSTSQKEKLQNTALQIIDDALKAGAVDDGEIIKYGYTHEVPELQIIELRTILRNNHCTKLYRDLDKEEYKTKRVEKKDWCAFTEDGKHAKFESVMRGCIGVNNGCEYLATKRLTKFYTQWKKNLDAMFAEFADEKVVVEGKISHWHRQDDIFGRKNAGWSILLFDTIVQRAKETTRKDTRKLWFEVGDKTFERYNKKYSFCKEDIITITGTLRWNAPTHDYRIFNVRSMKLVKKQGETPIG